MNATASTIRNVVEEVLAELGKSPRQVNGDNGQSTGSPMLKPASNPNGIPVVSNGTSTSPSGASAGHSGGGNYGVFDSVDEAVAAANHSFQQLKEKSMADRAAVIDIVKTMCEARAEEWGTKEFNETKIGRLDHKIGKLKIIKQVPGIEWFRPLCFSGDHGIALEERAPFGVIGAITPVTHSLPTLAGNIVNMVAAGNSIIFNPHPSGKNIACEGVQAFNRAIAEKIGIENLITIIGNPTIESANEIFHHRNVRMLCVTGGPAVGRAALGAKKRAVVAGPGNPPVVVDDSADIENAAKSIIAGAAFDNNLLCIGEKEVFAVQSIFDQLMDSVGRQGGYKLNAQQVEALTKLAFAPPKEPGGHPILNRDFIGADAAVLAQHIGLNVPQNTEILYGETDTNNPFVPEEQMMPFIPFVRARDTMHAIELAHEFEHGFGHTAIIHSRNVHAMTVMGKLMDTTLFVKNGPSMAGLGLGGEGYLSFSVATPTGEGVTNPGTFTRTRRCVMVDELRVV